jgi:anti-anti-sigma factor
MSVTPESTFDVRIETGDGEAIVVVSGDLDLAAQHPIGTALDRLRPFAAPVAVDLAAVTFIDSSGLLVLIRLREELSSQGHGFRIAGLSSPVEHLFEVSGVNGYLGLE